MRIPAPKPGLVIRYSFLWSHERAKGSDEGSKDRPCAIVVASARDRTGAIRTVVAPITHTPPDDPGSAIEIPTAVCRSLGLDAARHWLSFDELNAFVWPGHDLRPIPGRAGAYDYGMLPGALFEQVRQGILRRQKAKAGRMISRD